MAATCRIMPDTSVEHVSLGAQSNETDIEVTHPVCLCLRKLKLVKESLRIAEEFKLEGNDHFRAKKWDEALFAYRAGLGRLPPRKGKEKRTVHETSEEFDPQGGKERPVAVESEEESREERNPSPLEERCMKARSIMNANIGACYVNLVSPSTSSSRNPFNLALG
jgi:hypothetical protein